MTKINKLVQNEMRDHYYAVDEEDSGYYGPEATEASLKAFAELMVKECCKIILDNGYHNPIMRIHPENPEDIVAYVKEHFGIDDNLQ